MRLMLPLLAAGAASLERLYPHGLPHKLPSGSRVLGVRGKSVKVRLFQGEWGEGTSEGTSEGTGVGTGVGTGEGTGVGTF